MTDKPALMSREEVEERLAHCMDLKEMGLDEGCPLDLTQLEPLLRTALAFHQAYGKAIEDAAQMLENRLLDDSVDWDEFLIAGHIRQLKGTSNG